MKTLYIYNPFSNTYKNISSIIIVKELSKNNKVILLDFDNFSNIDKLLDDVHKINLFSNFSKEIVKKNNLTTFQINVLTANKINYDLLIEWFIDLKNIILNDYDYLIINSSSSNGILNKTIFNIIDDVLIPINLFKENSKEILEHLIILREKNDKKFNIHFFAITDYDDANHNAISFLKAKKNLSNLLLDTFIKITNLNNDISIINNEEISKSYLNIIKFLYNL